MADWLAKAAWKDKLGLRYELSFFPQYSNAGCGSYMCNLKKIP